MPITVKYIYVIKTGCTRVLQFEYFSRLFELQLEVLLPGKIVMILITFNKLLKQPGRLGPKILEIPF